MSKCKECGRVIAGTVADPIIHLSAGIFCVVCEDKRLLAGGGHPVARAYGKRCPYCGYSYGNVSACAMRCPQCETVSVPS